MTNDCKTCPVSTGTHKPAEAVHQIDEPQSEALRLAAWLLHRGMSGIKQNDIEASNQLRWLHAESLQHKQELAAYRFTVENREARIAELEGQLEAIGAGGVEPLRKPAAAPQAVQAAVPEAIEQMAADRYKVVPSHESMFHRWAVVAGNGTQQLYIGREVECLNMARKFSGAFLDGAFVAMQNTAPAHPAESVPAQIETLRSELAEEKEAADNWRRLALQFDIHRLQALWHLKRILHADSSVDEYKAAEQFLAAPPLDGEAVLAQRIAALAATQPAAQGVEAEIQQAVEAERERICAAIKAEDDHCVDQGDYMLDSNDCIEIVRGKWVRPDYSLDAAQAKQGGAA